MSTDYLAELTIPALRVKQAADQDVPAVEAYPIYGRDDADRWLQSRGYTLGSNWFRSGGLRRAVWSRQVTR